MQTILSTFPNSRQAGQFGAKRGKLSLNGFGLRSDGNESGAQSCQCEHRLLQKQTELSRAIFKGTYAIAQIASGAIVTWCVTLQAGYD